MLSIMNLYTFSVKPNWRTGILWIVAAVSSAVAYLCTFIPLGYSMVDTPGSWDFGGDAGEGRETTALNSSL